MTAVIAEDRGRAAGDRHREPVPAPDLWRDLAATIDRAGGDSRRLWVDDSKAILRGGKGRDRLEASCLALLGAVGVDPPGSIDGLLSALGAGTADEVEISQWLDPAADGPALRWCDLPRNLPAHFVKEALRPPGRCWQIVAARTVVVGPARFNARLAQAGSKARVH